MLDLYKDQFVDDLVLRAEQSRFSYNLQTEEFHNLNTNFQTYLNDIKKLDDENQQLQNTINQIRTNYFLTLENNLKRLPNDFRQESHILTEAHIERYKSKTHAKFHINEREELKKRIHFLVNNEKQENKYLNKLQKQEHLIHNEFQKLNEQMQNLYNYVQTEKQIHQQAMNKVDNLQVQLEHICIERSKTEFEIQTLREEVKLMQTTKEFLDEEHQTIISTQTEANDYFLSYLNQSILRIREDFNQLNQIQCKQIENEYKQMIKNLEENLLINKNLDEKLLHHQHTMQIQYEQLQNEHQSMIQELTALNNHNQFLSEQILTMEADLYSIRDERMKELIIKDNEFEQSKNELQTFNEKLNYLTEYDRNLKFELTLYRGVLENEYQRKQQQLINNQHPIRPTSLRNSKTYTMLTTRNQFEPIRKISNESINDISQEKYLPKSPVSTGSTDQQSPSESQFSAKISPINPETSMTASVSAPDLSSPLDDRQLLSETSNFPTSSTAPTLLLNQSSTSPSESQTLHAGSSMNEETLLVSNLLIPTEDHQTPTNTPELSYISPSTYSEVLSEAEKSLNTPSVSKDQQESSTQSDIHQSLATSQEEIPQLSTAPSINEQIPSNSSTSPSNTALPTDLSSSDVQQSPSTPSKEQSILTKYQEDIQQQASAPPQEQPSSIVTDQYQTITSIPTVNDENQLVQPSDKHEINKLLSTDVSLTSQEELNQNLNSSEENQIKTEEQTNSSSDHNKSEENSNISYISSSGYYGTLNDSIQLINEKQSKQSSLTDVENDLGEVDLSTSPKIEEKEFNNTNQSNLEAVMEDLRCVYRELINDEILIEINDHFSDNLIDRLEFGDNFIQTLFDEFLRKYIVQPAKTEKRLKTLDWIEFRDILFPILTGRYLERHIRKLFELYDTSKDGYLSLEEIIDLLELLQVNNTTELAQNIIKEYDKNQDEKLNVNEFIEAIKKEDDINNNILSQETEYKHWYIQHPIDEDINDIIKPISLEAPIQNSPSNINNNIILLGRIFKKVGADVENKHLDCNKSTLSMKITNEFINNNIHISNDDLQSFIQLYLNKKRKSDGFIKWIEFRDLFLPFINGGICSKDDITRWFDIFDVNHNRVITQEQILHLLRLLQIPKSEKVLNKISETYTNNTNSWTLEELIFALENFDETSIHLHSNTQQTSSFDIDWLTKNIF